DRTPQILGPADRFGLRRPLLLVLDNRLDDVELPGFSYWRRFDDYYVRRQPGISGCGNALAASRRDRHDVFRYQRAVPYAVPQGGHRARPDRRSERPTRYRLDRCAAPGRGLPLGV